MNMLGPDRHDALVLHIAIVPVHQQRQSRNLWGEGADQFNNIIAQTAEVRPTLVHAERLRDSTLDFLIRPAFFSIFPPHRIG